MIFRKSLQRELLKNNTNNQSKLKRSFNLPSDKRYTWYFIIAIVTSWINKPEAVRCACHHGSLSKREEERGHLSNISSKVIDCRIFAFLLPLLSFCFLTDRDLLVFLWWIVEVLLIKGHDMIFNAFIVNIIIKFSFSVSDLLLWKWKNAAFWNFSIGVYGINYCHCQGRHTFP